MSSGTFPAEKSFGLAAIFEKARTPRGAASVVALLVAGGVAGYNWALQTGAEAAIRDGLNASGVTNVPPSQLVQIPAFAFTNPLSAFPGTAKVLNREEDGCYMVEAKGGDTQGLRGRDTVEVKASGKVVETKPVTHIVKVCP